MNGIFAPSYRAETRLVRIVSWLHRSIVLWLHRNGFTRTSWWLADAKFYLDSRRRNRAW